MTIGKKSIYKNRPIKGTLTNQNNISHHYTDIVIQKKTGRMIKSHLLLLEWRVIIVKCISKANLETYYRLIILLFFFYIMNTIRFNTK
jgi:hypothetical protein